MFLFYVLSLNIGLVSLQATERYINWTPLADVLGMASVLGEIMLQRKWGNLCYRPMSLQQELLCTFLPSSETCREEEY